MCKEVQEMLIRISTLLDELANIDDFMWPEPLEEISNIIDLALRRNNNNGC